MTPRKTKQHGRGSLEIDGRHAYVALVHQKFGDRNLEPGDIVPIESGRNYALAVRHGLIAPVIDPNPA